MQIDITTATLAEKPILAALLELYQYEFTQYTREDIGDDGRYGMDRLPLYWTEDGRTPLLVRVDGKLAGFALVRRISEPGETPVGWDMTEFFVMIKYREQGVGETLARHAFDAFRGRWRIRVHHENARAKAFWRTIVGRYTDSDYREEADPDESWLGPVLWFEHGEGQR